MYKVLKSKFLIFFLSFAAYSAWAGGEKRGAENVGEDSRKAGRFEPNTRNAQSAFSELSRDAFGQVNQYLSALDLVRFASTSKSNYLEMQGSEKPYLDLSGARLTRENLENIFGQKGLFHHLDTLNLSGAQFDPAFLSLLPSTLKKLDLSGTQLTSIHLKNLSHLVNLVALNLSYNQIQDDGCEILGELKNLTSLSLRSNQIHAIGVEKLQKLVNLSRLDLSSNPIGNSGVEALGAMIRLTALDISSCGISDQIAGLTRLTQMKSLWIANNPIEDEGAKWISHLGELNELGVGHCDLTHLGVEYLSHLKGLQKLNLVWNDIRKSGRHLATLSNLIVLEISNTELKVEDIKQISTLIKLEQLGMASVMVNYGPISFRFSDEEIYNLTALSNLRELNLSDNGLHEGARFLSDLTHLEVINLDDNVIPEHTLAQIRANLPDTFVISRVQGGI